MFMALCSSIPTWGVGFGGLICDHTSSFIHGFFGKISSILNADILGLYHGLKSYSNIGFKQVLCLYDSAIEFDLIQKN